MESYDILLNEIKQFLNREEVSSENTNNEVISMHDLYKSINNELEDLRKLSETNSSLTKKLKNFMNFYFGATGEDKFYPGFKQVVKIYGDMKISSIIFCNDMYSLKVNKDRSGYDIYISEPLSKENKSIYKFIKRNYEIIVETLDKIEKYVELVGIIDETNKEYEMNFLNELFNGTLLYDKNGIVKVNINISAKHPLYDEYYKNYYKKQSVHEFVNESMEEILKRIPISPYQIDSNFFNIYNQNKETEKEKQIEKSIRWWN